MEQVRGGNVGLDSTFSLLLPPPPGAAACREITYPAPAGLSRHGQVRNPTSEDGEASLHNMHRLYGPHGTVTAL